MKKLIIISLVLIMVSCSNCDYQLTDLKKTKVSYSELPSKIINLIDDPSGYKDYDQEGNYRGYEEVICIDSSMQYRLETVKTWIGPWIDHLKLIDINRNISYRIELDNPSPYLILNSKLYTSGEYNLFTTVKDYSKLEFTRYELKEK